MGPVSRALATAISLLLLTAGTASAQGVPQTFTVNSTSDITDATPIDGACATAPPVVCTLRAAIQQANANAAADTIVFSVPGPFNLTIAGSDNVSAVGDLDITAPVTIDGGGARTTVIDQQTDDRVLEVTTPAGSVTLSEVTVQSGSVVGGGSGGGILNGANLTITDSAVRDNGVTGSTTNGGGIANSGSLAVERSAITNNQAQGGVGGGGGIFSSAGTVTIINSTITGNTATTGGAFRDASTSGTTNVRYSTIAGNTTNSGAAVHRASSTMTFRDTIVGPNGGTGTNCNTALLTEGHNIDTANTCGFNSATDKPNTNPTLGPFGYSRPEDQTETLVPQDGSPAIDTGNSAGCPASDQRGLPRPGFGTCDIGAVEVQPSPPPPPPPVPNVLLLDPPSANRTPGDDNTVTATVQLSNGAPAPGQSIRWEVDGVNETAGAVTTDASGRGQISWEGVHEGTDVMKAYVDTNRNLTADPNEPTGQASVVWALPAPRQGRTANIEPVSGRIRITLRRRGSSKVSAAGGVSQLLTEARQVPIDTVVDVRRGRVRMTTVANSAGAVQKGEFYGGVYTTRQPTTGRRPVTELRLTESLICQRSSRRGKLTASRARSRRLWGNARGRYRTRGRYSTATVRGTIWVQKDSCNSTTTAVRQGVVVVRDLVKGKNVRVRAGRRYVARRSR